MIKIHHPTGLINGQITLPASKSISNRLLILKKLYLPELTIHHLSEANDTVVMKKALNGSAAVWNVEDAGTAFRFLTAFAALGSPGVYITGTKRLLERPIAPLIKTLTNLGADITLDHTGIKINRQIAIKGNHQIDMRSVNSSQFISAICLIGPAMGGCSITINPAMNSFSYVQMTVDLMDRLGFDIALKSNKIVIGTAIPHGNKAYTVEGDWSSYSYWHTMVAHSKSVHLSFTNLTLNDVQKDLHFFKEANLNVDLVFNKGFLELRKLKGSLGSASLDFSDYPDLAPSYAIALAYIPGEHQLIGLSSLRNKESNRMEAISSHLNQLSVKHHLDENSMTIFGQANLLDQKQDLVFPTFKDHRMAMCLVPLAMSTPICIQNEQVVAKSYPRFWDDLASVGFEIEYL